MLFNSNATVLHALWLVESTGGRGTVVTEGQLYGYMYVNPCIVQWSAVFIKSSGTLNTQMRKTSQ